ncbi:MAG: pyridoxamine 5'-phosphate oxidase family protein [Negativicutes bacterium]|nr:pyridoxamine 5'-phosphate oxidase family protein [Negativicutes bacterium]
MFNDVRRQDRMLSEQETADVLMNGGYGVLSMVGTNDYGYGVPLSYVYRDNSIYVHCALEGQKLAFLQNNNKVSFCIVTEASPLPDAFSMKYKSVIAFGKAVDVTGEEKMTALVALIEKYASSDDYIVKGKEYAAQSFDKTAVLRLDIEHVTGKARR